MKPSEWKMILAGGAAWTVGTIYFLFRAAATFEHGPLVYWSNAVVTIVAYVLLFRRLLKLFGVEPHDTGWAALLFVLPGMTGEVLALLDSSVFLPGMRFESIVTYAAFLFAGYSSMGYYALYRQQHARASRGGRRAQHPSHGLHLRTDPTHHQEIGERVGLLASPGEVANGAILLDIITPMLAGQEPKFLVDNACRRWDDMTA